MSSCLAVIGRRFAAPGWSEPARRSSTPDLRQGRRRRATGPLALAAWAISACIGMAATSTAPAHSVQDKATQAALARLLQRAKETGSDAVVVYRNGVKILDYRSAKAAGPMYLMSCTKSITGLAVLKAIEDGKIKGLDEPVYDFYPEWNQGRKKLITIRMLLSMTSGIQHAGTGNEVYSAPDSVKQALTAELMSAPGSAFSYNNKAVDLLAGIVQIATGEQLDAYVDEHFFTPMGIGDWRWERDGVGNPYAMADLKLLPDDFAKIGLLVAQKGQWEGKSLIASKWVEELGRQSQAYEPLYGLLWWRIPSATSGAVTDRRLSALAAGGLDPKLLAELKTLQGHSYHSEFEWHRALAAVEPQWEDRMFVPGLIGPYGEDIPEWTYSGFDGISAEGYLGQYLVVFPERGLVAVRMIQPFEGYHFLANRFEDFGELVRALATAPAN